MPSNTASETASSYEFRIATVFRRTFAVYKRGFVLFLLLGIISTATRWLFNPAYGSVLRQLINWGLDSYWSAFLGWLAYAFFAAVVLKVVAGFAVYWVGDILDGQRPRLGAGLRGGVSGVLAVMAGAILTSGATYLGMLFLLVPGLILACLFIVVAPAASFEKIGVLTSIKRGSWLARGNLGRIFVLSIIPYAILFAYLRVVAYMGPLYSGGVEAYISSYLYYVLPGNVLYNSFMITLACVIYFELRATKEGVRTRALAGVFE